MLCLLRDENFNGDIIRGLFLCQPNLDLVRVQDVGLREVDDPSILAWAADNNRIVINYDRATMPDFAYQRLQRNEVMLSLFVVSDRISIRQTIDEILLLATCTEQAEWKGVVLYLPL